MSKINQCHMIADQCLLKIEAAGMKHDYDAALVGLTKPKYVLKYTNPTYDLQVFWNAQDMYDFLIEYQKEFEKKNKEISNKRRQQWLDEYRELILNECGEEAYEYGFIERPSNIDC